MDKIFLILNFVIEIGKYILGAKIFFDSEIKRMWVLVCGITSAAVTVSIFSLQNNEQYIITYLIAVITSLLIIGTREIKAIVNILLLFFGLMCFDGIVEAVIKSFIPKGAYQILVNSLIVFAIMLIIYCISNKDKWKVRKYITDVLAEKLLDYVWIVVVCMIINILFISTGLYMLRDNLSDGLFKICINISHIMSYVTVIGLILFMIYIRNANNKLKNIVNIEKKIHNTENKYYQSLLNKEEETRKNRHDWNNHLICIAELAGKENAAETMQYIEKLIQQIKNIQGKHFDVGNNIINALLNYYLTDIDKNIKISISGICKYKIDVESVDLCVIFSNLLRNAIEYLERTPLEKKELAIKLHQSEKYTQIMIKNNTDEKLSIKAINKTSKKDKQNHGIGLKNVKKAISKYSGILNIDIQDNYFIVEVILKNK